MITLPESARRYLSDLERASARLPKDRRDDLLEPIREHLTLAAAEPDRYDMTEVLRELGDPERLVYEAEQEDPPSVSHDVGGERAKQVSRVLAWLTVGSLIPFVGWAYGVVLLWQSRVWSVRDKIIGTLCFPFGLWGVLVALAFAGGAVVSASGSACSVRDAPAVPGEPVSTVAEACTTTTSGGLGGQWLVVLAVVIPIVLTVFGPAWLAWRARRAEPRQASASRAVVNDLA